jgi:hypothetical protein
MEDAVAENKSGKDTGGENKVVDTNLNPRRINDRDFNTCMREVNLECNDGFDVVSESAFTDLWARAFRK